MLNSWLNRLLVLLVFTTAVLTLLALQYVEPGSLSRSEPPPAAQAPPVAAAPAAEPTAAREPGFGFAQTGVNALQAGDAAAAIRWFERATQAAPLNPDYRRGLADAYRARGDSLRASEEGLRAWELEAQPPGTSGPSGD